MAIFTVGARLHDYGKGTPDELFGKVSADGFACVQLAYKKCVPGVASYADVTPQLVQNTLEAQKKHNIAVAVLGTYVELAIADEVQRSANAADFKSQLAVCKALNAGCVGTETTGMHKQPAGTTRERGHRRRSGPRAQLLLKPVATGVEPPDSRLKSQVRVDRLTQVVNDFAQSLAEHRLIGVHRIEQRIDVFAEILRQNGAVAFGELVETLLAGVCAAVQREQHIEIRFHERGHAMVDVLRRRLWKL